MWVAPALVPLPPVPAGIDFPTREWSEAPLGAGVDGARLERLFASAFAQPDDPELGHTKALLVVQHGAIVAERYAEGIEPESTQPSWSMAKSVLHAVVGLCLRDGVLDPAARAEVPEWSAPGDPRSAIAIEHLLRMTSGLGFVEDYVDAEISDAIAMLFGEGKDDVAHFAARKPLAHPPGTVFSYSSGSSNILSAIVKRALGGEARYREFLQRELLDRIGMRSALPMFDAAGTWVASSFIFACARDFARFGLLYLRDGVWAGERILPAGWVDHGRTPTPVATPEEPYGAHWWLGLDDLGTFAARGYEGQYTVVVPALDLVVVRLGRSPAECKPNLLAFLDEVIACFRLRSG